MRHVPLKCCDVCSGNIKVIKRRRRLMEEQQFIKNFVWMKLVVVVVIGYIWRGTFSFQSVSPHLFPENYTTTTLYKCSGHSCRLSLSLIPRLFCSSNRIQQLIYPQWQSAVTITPPFQTTGYTTLCLCVYTNPLEEEETLFLVPDVVTFDLIVKETKQINNI